MRPERCYFGWIFGSKHYGVAKAKGSSFAVTRFKVDLVQGPKSVSSNLFRLWARALVFSLYSYAGIS